MANGIEPCEAHGRAGAAAVVRRPSGPLRTGVGPQEGGGAARPGVDKSGNQRMNWVTGNGRRRTLVPVVTTSQSDTDNQKAGFRV